MSLIRNMLIVLLVAVCINADPAEKIPGLRPPGIQVPPPPIFFSKSIPQTQFQTQRQPVRQRRQIIEPEMLAPTYSLPEMFTDLSLNNPDFGIASGGGIFTNFITTPYKPPLTGTQFVVHNFVSPEYAGQTFVPLTAQFKPSSELYPTYTGPIFVPQLSSSQIILQIPPAQPSPPTERPYPPSKPALVYGVH